jgi:hypothetical protein
LTVRNTVIEKSVEDDETTTASQTIVERIKTWVSSQLQPTP